MRVCVPPQLPQDCVSLSVAPAMHSPSPMQVQASHVQSVRHVRRRVPQLPQVAPDSVCPGMQAPAPSHAPSFTHAPPVHTCRCVPQYPQSMVRGGVPSSQSHSVGASHSVQAPSVHCISPSPHAPAQSSSCVVPTEGSSSSQSDAAGTPSPSASAPVATHTPSRQTSPSPHEGTHPGGPASIPPPPSPPRRFTPSSPSAQPASERARSAESQRTWRTVSQTAPRRARSRGPFAPWSPAGARCATLEPTGVCMGRPSLLLAVLVSVVLIAGCRRGRDDEDAGRAPRDAGPRIDAGSGVDAGPRDSGPPEVDAGPPDAGTSVEDTAAVLAALERAATIASLTAGPLVADAEMVDSMGDGATDATIRERVESGVATNSIVDDAACVAFSWSARTATITFTGCTSETTGLSIDGTVTLAVTLRPTTFAITFDALAIGGTTIDGALALVVRRASGAATFSVDADLSWTDGTTSSAVTLTDVAVVADAEAMTTTLGGGFEVTAGATSASGSLDAVTWAFGDCHASSGDATIRFTGSPAFAATFLPATPTEGVVRVAIPPLPAVEMMMLEPC